MGDRDWAAEMKFLLNSENQAIANKDTIFFKEKERNENELSKKRSVSLSFRTPRTPSVADVPSVSTLIAKDEQSICGAFKIVSR